MKFSEPVLSIYKLLKLRVIVLIDNVSAKQLCCVIYEV